MLSEYFYEHTVAAALIFWALAGALLLGLYSFLRHMPRGRPTPFLALIRLFFLALLFWCLLMPVARRSTRRVLKPRFLVVLDTSASMTLTPDGETVTRWQTAREVLSQPWTSTMKDRADVDLFAFDDAPGARRDPDDWPELTPDGAATHLRASLRRIVERYRGQNLAGLLLLSDGIDTREAGDDWTAETWPAPIFSVRLEPPGIWEIEPDIRVDAVNTPRRVVVDWDTELSAVISGQGTGGAMIPVQLFKDDELVREIPTRIPEGGGSREVLFRLEHDTVGNFTYTVNLPPLPGETNTNDNFFAVTVLVTDARNRLLYVEGVPRWESKFINRVLQGNSLVTPLSFVRGPAGQFLTYGARGPITTDMTEDELKHFKILIVGNMDTGELGEERAGNIAKFIEDGGSLALLGGNKAWGSEGFQETALNNLLPLRSSPHAAPAEGRFNTRIAEEGMQHPVIRELRELSGDLPPLLSYFPGGELSPGATALVEVEDAGQFQPVIAVQRYGHGKVAAILTDSLWRWRLHPGPGNHYDAFWNQLIAWLSPAEAELDEHQLDLFGDTDSLFMGETIRLQARLGSRDEAALRRLSASCEIVTPSGRRIPFRMPPQPVTTGDGRTLPGFAVEFSPDEAGLHRASAVAAVDNERIESQPYSFYVRPFTPESNPRPANVDLLRALAESSGGRFLEPDEVDRVLSALTMTGGEEERVEFHSRWNNWWFLAAMILLLTVEWVTRKFKDMA